MSSTYTTGRDPWQPILVFADGTIPVHGLLAEKMAAIGIQVVSAPTPRAEVTLNDERLLPRLLGAPPDISGNRRARRAAWATARKTKR